MDMILERTFWDLHKLESIGKKEVIKQLDEIVNTSKLGFDALIAYGEKFEALYVANINSIVLESKEILGFLTEIRSLSKEAYIFLTSGHDILNLNEYLKFKGLEYIKKLERYKDFMEFTRYFRYFLKKIINEPDKERQKIMLKGLLGI